MAESSDEKRDSAEQSARRPIDREKVIRLILRSLPIPLFGASVELYDLLRDVQKSRTSLDEKVRKAADSLVETSAIVAELQAELTERITKVDRLRDEYARYQELAQLEESKARALIDQLERAVDRGKGRERWIALGINLAAGVVIFVLGVLLGPWLSKILNLSA